MALKGSEDEFQMRLLGWSKGFIVLFFSGNPGKLQQLAALPVGAPLWVQIGQQDELAEAELKFVGPLTRGSSAVVFGVQLKVNSRRTWVKNSKAIRSDLQIEPNNVTDIEVITQKVSDTSSCR